MGASECVFSLAARRMSPVCPLRAPEQGGELQPGRKSGGVLALVLLGRAHPVPRGLGGARRGSLPAREKRSESHSSPEPRTCVTPPCGALRALSGDFGVPQCRGCTT